ncbi:MAG: hypothetical protein O2887_17045 [Bacteroidetes bacterium]|nr:hypothetical protein [Bacteroidota bacterium]MDA1122168.1 hypothetical protein [Bacteroidota bacterium]
MQESNSDVYAKEHPEFITVTCIEWKHLLEDDRFKEIVINSLRYLSNAQRIIVSSFVIMSNHIHMIWQILGEHRQKDVQRDFLKFTGQQCLNIYEMRTQPY